MAITNNPNKAKGIEARWRKEINERWRNFSAAIKNIPLKSVVSNVTQSEQQEIDQYMNQFLILSTSLLLSGNGAWQNKFQLSAYSRAVKRTNKQFNSMIPETEVARSLITQDGFNLNAIDDHRNESAFLLNRSREALQKWIAALNSEARTILFNNIGVLTIPEINALIKERISVSKSRAKVISTTETAQASQRGVIVQTAVIGAAFKDSVNVRWITMDDSKVRHLHASWHG